MWSGWRLTRKQFTSRPDHLWPEFWKSMGKHAKLKEKQKWTEERVHLGKTRKLRGIYFIGPEETIKNARKKLEKSVSPAMPYKIAKNCGSGAYNKIETKLACILEADEATRIMRMRNSIPHHHEDHIQEKVKIHYSTTIWFTNLFLCLKLWEFRQRKQRWTRNGKNGENFGVEIDKSKVRKRWSMKRGRRALQFILHH